MTPKELKRLSRSDLLEMLLDLSRENDRLHKENEYLRSRVEDRKITIDSCGSLAEAALQLSGIFQAAQEACQLYSDNICQRSAQLEEHCRSREQEVQARCDAMLDQARQQAQAILEEARNKQTDQEDAYLWLRELMDGSDCR